MGDLVPGHYRKIYTLWIRYVANVAPLQLAGRAQRTLALVLEILWRVSKDMALFQSWCHLFPDKDFGVLNDSVQKVYEEVIRFFIAAVRFLRRHPAGKLLDVVFSHC